MDWIDSGCEFSEWSMTIGDKVQKLSGDYVYYGTIVADFQKRSGHRRLVVENSDGMLFIFNEKQLQPWSG